MSTPPPVKPRFTDDRSNAGLLKASGSQVIPTLISRITGFLKLLALAATIGLGAAGSSFAVANTLPNIVSELVLGAVLTSIVVPVLVRAEREDADGGTEFTRRLLTVAGTVLLTATAASLVGAPWLIHLFLDPDGEVDTRLATLFAFLLLPQILFYGLGALFGAILNTRGIFARVAWAPVLNNVVTLAVIIAYYLTPGELQNSLANPKLLVLGIGTTLGIVAQAAYLVPALRRMGVDLRPRWGIDARLKHFGGMGVAVLGYVLVSQVGLVITNRVASQYDASGPVLFQYAWLLLQVPYGVLGVSLITAIMPRMSRAAAANDTQNVVTDLSLASRLSIVGLLPIVALFTVHGSTLGIALFSLRGSADAIDNAGRLGATVAVSAFGLLPFAVGLIQVRVFYARQQPWIPTYLMALAVLVRIPFMLWIPPFVRPDQVVGWLSFMNGMGFAVAALAGGVVLWRQLGHVDTRALVRTTATVLATSLIALAIDALIGLVLPLSTFQNAFGVLLGALLAIAMHTIVVLGIGYGLLLVFKLPETAGMSDALLARLPGRLGTATRGQAKTPAERSETNPGMFEATTLLPRLAGSPLPYREPSSHNASATRRGPVPDDGRGGTRPTPTPRPRDSGTQEFGTQEFGTRPPPLPAGATSHRKVVRGPALVPGAAVAGGRYRLLASHGGPAPLQFWQARDTLLNREVALTFVDADQAADPEAPDGPQAVLHRTLQLGRLRSPGLARVLDVVHGSSGGIVVSEWVEGRSLKEVASTEPPAVGAARAVRALAGAAESAHRDGAVLGVDHPDRVRISSAGHAVLAFPAVPVGADQYTDVRGLGAVLYALVADAWPLEDPANRGLASSAPIGDFAPAQRREDGSAVPARAVRPGVPYEISAVIARALQPETGVRTAAAVQTVLEQASVLNQQTDLMRVIDDRGPLDRPRTGEAPLDYGRPAHHSSTEVEQTRRAPRQRSLLLVVSALALVIVAVVVFGILQLTSALGTGDAPLPSLSGPGTSSVPTSPGPGSSAAPSSSGSPNQASSPVIPSNAAVFSPKGTKDDARNAGKAIDGNATTYWTTDEYIQQLPALKQGVGLLLTLPESTALRSVDIASPSSGTVVQIRAADSSSPDLSATTLLSTTNLQTGSTTVTLDNMEPTKYLLVWITELGGSSSPYDSKISELTLQRAG